MSAAAAGSTSESSALNQLALDSVRGGYGQ